MLNENASITYLGPDNESKRTIREKVRGWLAAKLDKRKQLWREAEERVRAYRQRSIRAIAQVERNGDGSLTYLISDGENMVEVSKAEYEAHLKHERTSAN